MSHSELFVSFFTYNSVGNLVDLVYETVRFLLAKGCTAFALCFITSHHPIHPNEKNEGSHSHMKSSSCGGILETALLCNSVMRGLSWQ